MGGVGNDSTDKSGAIKLDDNGAMENSLNPVPPILPQCYLKGKGSLITLIR